jgi:hypothetical protein
VGAGGTLTIGLFPFCRRLAARWRTIGLLCCVFLACPMLACQSSIWRYVFISIAPLPLLFFSLFLLLVSIAPSPQLGSCRRLRAYDYLWCKLHRIANFGFLGLYAALCSFLQPFVQTSSIDRSRFRRLLRVLFLYSGIWQSRDLCCGQNGKKGGKREKVLTFLYRLLFFSLLFIFFSISFFPCSFGHSSSSHLHLFIPRVILCLDVG